MSASRRDGSAASSGTGALSRPTAAGRPLSRPGPNSASADGPGVPSLAQRLVSAAVPEDAAEPSRRDADTSFSSASYSSISRPAHAELGKTFDVASTRRRPVVFEEDDDLDVPDFLK